MTIKTVSRRNWPDGADRSFATWYEPYDDQARVTAAVSWVLARRGDRHPHRRGRQTAEDAAGGRAPRRPPRPNAYSWATGTTRRRSSPCRSDTRAQARSISRVLSLKRSPGLDRAGPASTPCSLPTKARCLSVDSHNRSPFRSYPVSTGVREGRRVPRRGWRRSQRDPAAGFGRRPPHPGGGRSWTASRSARDPPGLDRRRGHRPPVGIGPDLQAQPVGERPRQLGVVAVRPRLDVPPRTARALGRRAVVDDDACFTPSTVRTYRTRSCSCGHEQASLHAAEASFAAGHLQRLLGARGGGALGVDLPVRGAAVSQAAHSTTLPAAPAPGWPRREPPLAAPRRRRALPRRHGVVAASGQHQRERRQENPC